MKKLSTFSGNESEKRCFQMRNRQETILRLRHQAWQASLLLYSPWLLSIVLYVPIFRNEPASMLTLLVGLAVAFHIQRNLFHHLASNHRDREEDELFPTLGTANWITLLRAGAVVALAGLLPMAIHKSQAISIGLSWAPGIIYLGISLVDLLDGIVARREGQETELGKKLDIETDAAGLMVASLLAVALGRLSVSYLLVGLAYYFFILGIWMRQKRALPVAGLQSRPYARIIAGFQMGLVGVALLPIFNPVFTRIAGLVFMTPLLLGFVRDWLVVSCRLKTDADQQSRLDHWAEAIAMRALPLLLRLAIAAGGIMTLNTYPVYQTHLSWLLAHSFCCLLAAFGFMGRSASLLLILLLGCNQSPFGISLTSQVIFSIAVSLMLIGSGIMSVWAPEENILYRSNINEPRRCRETP